MGKTIIYYFTGTGNSLFAAKQLQSRLPGCEIEPIVKILNGNAAKIEAEAIGFVFPVIMMSAPLPLLQLIEKCDFSGAEYLFAVATRKGTTHASFKAIDRLLGKKGKSLNAFFNLQMGNNSAKHNYVAPTPERLKELEGSAVSQIESISKVIAGRQTCREDDTTATQNLPKALIKLSGLAYIKNDKLLADEKCTGCGTCAKVCPSGRITMAGGKPCWDNSIKCYRCAACINFCPVQSVQIKNFTETSERYSHPYATAGDISAQK